MEMQQERETELPSPASLPYLPFLSIYRCGGTGRCHGTHNATYDARHPVQVVDAARVLDTQVGLQERLRRGDSCHSGREPWPACLGDPKHRDGGLLQSPAWGPYRQVHKAQGGDDAADEANNEGAVRHEHHLRGSAHGHPTGQRGVLDVHLGEVGRAGRTSVFPESTGQEELKHLPQWCDMKGDTMFPQPPWRGGPDSKVMPL